jgi:1,4-alpha-glucan branching enzyme
MIKKNYSKSKKICRVTFRHSPEAADQMTLLGDFNEWGGEEMKRRKDGSFSITLSLDAGKEYSFRYLADKKNWINDDGADELRANSFGTQNSVLRV